MAERPYAVARYIIKFDVWPAKQRGRDATEGYTLCRERYATPAKAWKQADYTSSLHPDHPSHVVDIHTGERVDPPSSD